MKNLKTVVGGLVPIVALTFGMAGCSVGGSDVTMAESQGIALASHTPTEVVGAYQVDGSSRIEFSSVEDSVGVVTIAFGFDGQIVTYEIDRETAALKLTADGVVVSPETKTLLHRLSVDLVEVLPAEKTAAEQMLQGMASHMSTVPESVELQDYANASAERAAIELLTCSCAYRYQTCPYSGIYLAGRTKGEQCYGGCAGRCGIGCGPDMMHAWDWGSGTYSRDCWCHDHGAQGWTYAADDYASAWFNC